MAGKFERIANQLWKDFGSLQTVELPGNMFKVYPKHVLNELADRLLDFLTIIDKVSFVDGSELGFAVEDLGNRVANLMYRAKNKEIVEYDGMYGTAQDFSNIRKWAQKVDALLKRRQNNYVNMGMSRKYFIKGVYDGYQAYKFQSRLIPYIKETRDLMLELAKRGKPDQHAADVPAVDVYSKKDFYDIAKRWRVAYGMAQNLPRHYVASENNLNYYEVILKGLLDYVTVMNNLAITLNRPVGRNAWTVASTLQKWAGATFDVLLTGIIKLLDS